MKLHETIFKLQVRVANMRRAKIQANIAKRIDGCIDAHLASNSNEEIELVSKDPREFVMDLRASSHVAYKRNIIENYHKSSFSSDINYASDAWLPIRRIGNLNIEMPCLICNQPSISKLTNSWHQVLYNNKLYLVTDYLNNKTVHISAYRDTQNG